MAEELPVDPYPQSNANAGAKPFAGEGMARAFGGQAGIRRITARFVELTWPIPGSRRSSPSTTSCGYSARWSKTCNAQRAMREAHVSFAAQNRVLAKLAPMERDVTER